MELQTQVGGQNKPPGNLLLFASAGQGVGQFLQQTLLETAVEKIPLIGLADDFQVVELPSAEGLQDFLRLILNETEVHEGGGQSTCCFWTISSAKASSWELSLSSLARAFCERFQAAANLRTRARSAAGTG